MLEHANDLPIKPARAVVLGAGGFVGKATVERLRADGSAVLASGRTHVDLLAPNAAAQLSDQLRADDALVIASAKAPCKNAEMMRDNIAMMATICKTLHAAPVAHVVYISSDAVYGDEPVPLTEDSPAAPGSLHGAMHLAREIMLREVCRCPLAILRPTLIYGASDPHNGYGPNRFRRLAAAGEPIRLFGEGEERRDHVLVDDVADIVRLVLMHRSRGVLNLATGTVTSFREIAEMVVAMYPTRVRIEPSPRHGPMPHQGFRPFDISATRAAFDDFHYTPLPEGLERVHALTLHTKAGAR